MVAAAATLCLGFSAHVGFAAFVVGALLTGVGTSALCLKSGRLYSGIPLGESLTAGGLSLVLAMFLYFVGIGIPVEWRLPYIAALPLFSAFLLTMRSDEQFPAGAAFEEHDHGANKAERRIYHRLVAASAVVAFTAGVGKGVSSTGGTAGAFSYEGAVISFVVGLIGVAIVVLVNRASVRRGARQVYSALMVLGIVMMLATCLGFDIAYLSIGKESLWMVLSCFLAYVSFRYDLSPIRTFGFGQAAYFLSSTVGWAVGHYLYPYYGQPTVLMGTGMALALLVLLVLVYLFPEWMVKRITDASRDVVPFHSRYRQLASIAEPGAVAVGANDATATARTAGGAAGSSASSRAASGETAVKTVGEMAKETAAEVAVEANGGADDHADRGARCVGEMAGRSGRTAGMDDAATTTRAHGGATFVAAGYPPVPAAASAAARPTEPSSPRGLERAALPVYGLSGRELEILDLFSQGRSASWIADFLTISKNTVRSHLRSIYMKLDVHTRQELLDFLDGKDASES